jgi:lysophospholipase L1-like esterase
MPIRAGSRYVAMGSSFAAGPGLPSRVPGSPRRAGRSTGNYAHLVARALSLDLHDVTFSGATTGDILGPSAAGQPAQVDALTPDTALVTITAGGNDVGWDYVAASAASAGHHAWSAVPWTRRFHLSLRGGAPYHPNAAGMAAVAGLVIEALAEDRQ